ncbi:MAG: ATP-grasp domain-containing protein [Planctomycetes bacterium]|nr:ATP-grasp domain-containing protein [Planctomycetota bacterium]
MQVFVSEYVCGGGWPGAEISGSLATEGRAMLAAVVADLSRLENVSVVATWDRRLPPPPFPAGVTRLVDSPADEARQFDHLVSTSDAVLVIAPELGGTLLERCRRVEQLGGRLLGPSSPAVALCADKYQLAEHWRASGISTIPTCECGTPTADSRPYFPFTFPAVLKPRHGAGSQDMHLVHSAAELTTRPELAAMLADPKFIIQPYLEGTACSVSLLISPDGRSVEPLLPGKQYVSSEDQFVYRGGQIPWSGDRAEQLQHAAFTACRGIPGLTGYVGVDLLIPTKAGRPPLVVEINPRLTTSYLGYRQATDDNLTVWMLYPEQFANPVRWKPGVVEFGADGQIVSRRN